MRLSSSSMAEAGGGPRRLDSRRILADAAQLASFSHDEDSKKVSLCPRLVLHPRSFLRPYLPVAQMEMAKSYSQKTYKLGISTSQRGGSSSHMGGADADAGRGKGRRSL